MSYNLTWMNTSTPSLGNIITNSNTLLNGLLFTILLVVIFFALFKYLQGTQDKDTVLIVIFFVLTIISTLAWIAGFIEWWLVMIFLICFLFALIKSFFD